MRASLTGWMILTAVLALSAGALAGSGEARMSGMEGRVAALQALVADRDALVASLTAELDQYRDRVDTAHMETQAAQAALRVNRALLDDAAHRLYDTEATVARQQAEMRMLKRCLAGAMQALQTMAGGDAFEAMRYVMGVEGECRASQGLLNAETSVE